jgi:ubiquinone/menaquinone biosynthesis C-methylase UbiE
MHTADELKQIFQEGWNIPVRIDNYVHNVAEREFTEGECPTAWKKCLAAGIPAGRAAKILDVGTGPGIFACLYAQMGHTCTGLDFSKRMLSEAQKLAKRIAPRCSFIFGDAEKPPFEDETFDVVSSRHLLFNLPHPGAAIRRWAQLLKPGGTMILIGEDVREQPGKASRIRIKQSLRKPQRNKQSDSKPGWHPSADYLKAVSQCPLFKHGKGTLQAVMEAAGMEDIHSLCTEEIAAARRNSRQSASGSPSFVSKPFILVGRKP